MLQHRSSRAPSAFCYLTLAAIGFGAANAWNALGATCDVDADGQLERVAAVVTNASELSAEWARRYGSDGLAPGRFDQDDLAALAMEFGQAYATALAKDPDASPRPVIERLLNDLDPQFAELEDKAKADDQAIMVIADFKGDQGVQIWRMGLFDSEDDAREEWEAYRKAVCPEAELLSFQTVSIADVATAS